MAEIIAAEILKVVFQKLADEAMKQFFRSQGIHSELKNLNKTLSKIQNLLTDASEKENGDKDVKDWLNSLQHLAYDIDDILDGLATDAMHRELTEESGETTNKVRKFIPSCCTNFSLSNKFSHKLDSIATKLRDLEKEKDALGLIVKDKKPKDTSRRYETSLPDASGIIGREDEIKKLLHKLLGDDETCDQKFSVVPIVGMGGVGKTTLARVLYNETQVNDHFELKIWVCVSDEFDVLKISKTIFQEVTREDKEYGNLNQVQTDIIEKLKDKRFLLVLDDVWSDNYFDWENLVRPFHSGAPGSKIIMTTRKERLLEKLGYDHLDRLKSLPHDYALSLFAYHALGVHNFDSHPILKPQGEGIVNKCGGLPLALKALGRLLRTKADVEDWDDVLNSEIWGLDNVDEIVPALRLSYHDLPAYLKQLFAYCSLFPKDFLFDKDDLVLLWMAEGFLNQSVANKSTELLGHEYFKMLLSRSFFQLSPNEESLYVMHDLMNDLATFVAGDYFLRFDNHMEIEKEALAKYRHMSFIREKYVCYQKFDTFKKAKSLRTFLAVSIGVNGGWDYFHLSNKILVDLLPELPLLRVLCLSRFRISELPEFIGGLKQLRYLNLSQTDITILPENVCNLYNLESLIVFGCHKLSKLPGSFSKLKNLRHFDIRDTPLVKKMPLGIGELKNLQTLSKIVIGGDDGFVITELKKLKNLHGKTSIKGLDKVKSTTYARDTKLSLNRFSELGLEWSNVFDGSRNGTLEKEVLNELKPNNDKLTKLEIMSYGGMDFPNWVGDPSFLRLVYVSINGCKKCASLPSLCQLPSLKKLYIKDMTDVKVVGSELFGITGVAFPSLEILHFEDMQSWEVWSMNSGVVFPCLQELRLSNCPNLVKVSFESLPSLRVLEISQCGDGVLRSIVCATSSITKLKIGSILGLTDEAWKGVMMYLGAVEELEVSSCNEIRYLWESEAQANKVLVNLIFLRIQSCSNLVNLGEKEENEGNCGSNLLTSLRTLYVFGCNSMKHCICGNNMEILSISSCTSLTSISFPTGGGKQNLKSLELFDCEKLLIKDLGGERNVNNISRRMDMLEFVRISLSPNLKSISGLSYSIHLTRLYIQDCPTLESFLDTELLNLTSLIDLMIKNCPSMNASFPSGNWPPNLCTLTIGSLKKPLVEWGHQNFPSSLVELQLHGVGDDKCNNISQLSDLLPTSLTELCIFGFEKLETVSKGLQHLASLQHLEIEACPNVKDLPEKLLPSLLGLTIWKCPTLEERSNARGSQYWPLISHIPKINIYDAKEFSKTEIVPTNCVLEELHVFCCYVYVSCWLNEN